MFCLLFPESSVSLLLVLEVMQKYYGQHVCLIVNDVTAVILHIVLYDISVKCGVMSVLCMLRPAFEFQHMFKVSHPFCMFFFSPSPCLALCVVCKYHSVLFCTI